MNLTAKQLRIFNRLHKKYPVSLEFLDYNIERILKFVKYSFSLHFICKCKLIQRNFRIFIRYNVSKKNIYNLKHQNNKKSQNKKYHNKIKKLQALPWTQRVVFYLKKKRLLEKIKQNNEYIEDDINYDLKSTTATYIDENSLSNSQSVIDVDISLMNSDKLKSNFQFQNNEEIKHSFTYNDKIINSENLKDFFCEKTGTLKKNTELFSKDKKLNQFEGEINDETADSDSEQQASEIGYNILSSEQIEEQLKTQLELLKCGKRSLSLLSEKFSEDSKKSEQNSKEKNETNIKLSDLINNKRLSSENYKIIEETEELSEGTVSTDIITFKNSEKKKHTVDESNEISLTKCKELVAYSATERSTIDSFEISEKDAMEAGPSSKEPSLFKTDNQEIKKVENILKICNLSSEIVVYKPNTLCKSIDNQKKGTNIVDCLISKLGNSLETSDRDDKEYKEKTITVKTVEQINNSTNNDKIDINKISLKVQDENSSSSDDFFGFSPSEIITPQIPGMLPTPAVPAFSSISAFISKDDKHSAIQKYGNTCLPKKYEDGLVRTGYPAPKFEMAALPEEMSKPRTLAEKRIIFSKQRSFKYFMIENENTIFHELKRRARDGRINTSFVRSVQRSRVPASRDLWKATCWLLTENEKFYFQTIEIDGIQCKILSGLGNFVLRKLPPQYSSPLMKKDLKRLDIKGCSDNCIDKKTWQTIRVRYNNPTMKMHISQLKKLKLFREEYRPGPLCFKKKFFKDIDGSFNQLEIYRMPKIELEIYPKLNHPLDDYIKSYLKMILPSNSITKEWAEFAVSTLVEKANHYSDNVGMKDSDGKIIQTKNSFKFTIPYLNDQTHILVRRVLTRSENFNNKETLKFREVLKNNDDKISLECADILSEMIDSVAIGLSENSFIQNDPDINYTKTNIFFNQNENIIFPPIIDHKLEEVQNNNNEVIVEKNNMELYKKNNKKGRNPKSKLMAELKRLNATIINASDAKLAKTKVCEKEYCRLGCVCISLSANCIPKKHCKKVKCMLEKCNCPLTLIEAGNSVITSEDAFILRQKATARLARMEREFTSTVVLTGSETLLINENQTKRKRRNNARLSNYYIKGLEDEEIKTLQNPRSKNATPTNLNSTSPSDYFANEEDLKESTSPVKEAKLPVDINDICCINEDVMKSLKHCTVDLYQLENLKDKVIWCMVHCLYKCFCNGKDTEGKPYVLKKQEEERIGEIYTRKAKYSFDKSEDENSLLEPLSKQIKLDESLHYDQKNLIRNLSPCNDINLKANKISKPHIEANDIVTPELKHKESRIISAYVNNDFYGCHRVQPVPHVYKIRNKRKEIKNHWRKFTENEKTKQLLNERIRLSENYIRKVIVKRPPGSIQQSCYESNKYPICKNFETETELPNANATTTHKNKFENVTELQITNNIPTQMSLIKPEVRAKLKLTSTNGSSKQQPKQLMNLEQLPLVTLDLNPNSSSPLFKISSVYSLNEHQNITLGKDFGIKYEINEMVDKNASEFEKADRNKNVLTSSLLQQQTNTSLQSNEKFVLAAEQVQKEVMKRLNYSVTKTMHNITKIQSEENAIIPNPQNDMMITVQWKHFLQYYVKDKIHIWQVKIDKSTYFVGTMKHIMPYVVNAIGVVNIKAIRKDNLPLFAQMLNAKFTNLQTESLSVLMTGHRDYWRILGMTKSNHIGTRAGVIRPTTESHPKLTPKINKLFNILTQQYIENIKRKNGITQQIAPTSIASLQHASKKIKIDEISTQLNSSQNKKQGQKINLISNPQTMVVINNYNLKNIDQVQNKNSGVAILNNVNTNKINIQKPKELKMNIKIRKLTKEEAMTEHFQVPITSNAGDHRWLVLDLEDDFSHIIFGNSMESLSLNKIKLALQRSQAENKMVRFPQVDGHSVDCYIMKFDKKRIYLGPFHETIDPVIILYQNVDGKTLIVRENYEILRGIKRQKHTTGFWLCRKNGKIMFDMDPWSVETNETFQQPSQQNTLQQLYFNKVSPSVPNKISCNETPNSIIKLIPENMPLIQSQCTNLSVSKLTSKNEISEPHLSKITSQKINGELPIVQQQIIQQVNKMIKRTCIITSITESSPNNTKVMNLNNSNNPLLKPVDNTKESLNILKDSVLISGPSISGSTSIKELENKISLSNTNESGIFSSNVQNKTKECMIKTQKCTKIGDITTTLATSGSSVITSNALPSSIPSITTQNYAIPALKPIVYGPHMQTPPLKKTILTKNISPKKSCSQLITPSTTPCPILLPKRLETPPSSLRNSNINLIKTTLTDSTGKSCSTKIIGKYNQVIISKTTDTKLVENNSINQIIKPEFQNNGPVTAEVEEQGGQLILKLPEKFQHKFLSQQFIVSKNENGKLILEPSKNSLSSTISTSETTKKMYDSEASSSTDEISQALLKKLPNNKQTTSELTPLSTSGTMSTSTIPVLSTFLTTDLKTKSNQSNNTSTPIQNSKNTNILIKQTSGILTLKNKETCENNSFSPLISKVSKCNVVGVNNLSKQHDKGIFTNSTLKQQFVSFSQQTSTPFITSKIEQSNNLLPNSTKILEKKKSNQDLQLKNESQKTIIVDPTVTEQVVTTNTGIIRPKTVHNTNNTENKNINDISMKIPVENLKPLLKTPEKSSILDFKQSSPAKITRKSLPTNTLCSMQIPNKSKDLRKIYTAKRLSLPITSGSNRLSLNAARKKISLSNERIMLSATDFQSKGYQAGYFVSNIKNYPKFGGFRKGNEYLIKTNVSVLPLSSIAEVSKHLNSFIKKQSQTCGEGKWQFVPLKNQISALTNSKPKKIAQKERERKAFNVSIEDKNVIVIDDDDDDDEEKSDKK